MDNRERLDLIKAGFLEYENVVDREIHYVFFDKDTRTYDELVFKPLKRDFMHLCGVTYKNWTEKQFYSALRSAVRGKNTFLPHELKVKSDGTTDQKLHVIKQLKCLLSCDDLSIISKPTTYANLRFLKGIRTRKMIFCLGLKNRTLSVFAPLSLLNLRSDNKGKTLDKGWPVQCIYSVDHKRQTKEILCQTTDFIIYEQTHTYPYPY